MQDATEEQQQATLARLDAVDIDDAFMLPSGEESEAMLKAFCTRWLSSDVHMTGTAEWICGRFGLCIDTFQWATFDYQLSLERMRMKILRHLCKVHGIVTMNQEFDKAMRVIFAARDMLMQMARVCNLACYDDESRRQLLPEGTLLNEDTLYDVDAAKITSFQNVFLYVRTILEGYHFRRCHGKYYERVVTSYGVHTLAFRQKISISEFVSNHTDHMGNFQAFLWVTQSGRNFEQLVEYLTLRVVPETPDLVECDHLRSYAGDEIGRGGGVYDSAHDVFFPYHLRKDWGTIAEVSTRVRRQRCGWKGAFDEEGRRMQYKCPVPCNTDVCVIHFDKVFPYDTYHELLLLESHPLGCRWRNAQKYECVYNSDDFDDEDLAKQLLCTLPPHGSDAEVVGASLGLSWLPFALDDAMLCQAWRTVVNDRDERMPSATDLAAVDQDALGDAIGAMLPKKTQGPEWVSARRMAPTLAGQLLSGRFMFDPDDLAYARTLEEVKQLSRHHFVLDVTALCAWIPVEAPAKRARMQLSVAEAVAYGLVKTRRSRSGEDEVVAKISPNAHVCVLDTDGTEYYFRLDQGRTWLECNAPEVDHIYECQKFCEHDMFMLYACKGRLLYKVNELDRAALTLFFQGVGGCGKSTIMKTQMYFWPPHLRGILSSNTQPKFGMSAVAGARTVFCNEVSSELEIVQEEWQASVSGESLTLAVKFKEPLVIEAWTANHFWVGNQFPDKFNNLQCQVSRRMAGVLMEYKVTPRDASITEFMFRGIGALQRKMVLAYREFFSRMYATLDVMSMVDQLPPAFRSFFYRSMHKTNHVERFLSQSGMVKQDEHGCMLLLDFKKLFDCWRNTEDLDHRGTLRWSEALYASPFADRGLRIELCEEIVISFTTHKHVNVIYGLKEAGSNNDPNAALMDEE